MWDKINSCHLHRLDGEMCGLNFLGRLRLLPCQPGNVFIKDNIVGFSSSLVVAAKRLNCGCLAPSSAGTVAAVRAGGATLAKQTCRGGCATGCPHVNPILAVHEEPAATDVI